MERTATSADGSTLTFDDLGEGPPVLLLPGALCTRGVTRPLADLLVEGGSRVLNLDRRGRGGSTDASGDPWPAEREVEDVAAVLATLDAPATVYGHSSGAGLALRCAAAGLPVAALVLHDAPYNVDASAAPASQRYRRELLELLRDGRPAEAVAHFLGGVGMPREAALETGRHLAPVGPTLAYDSAAMGDEDGGTVPTALLPSVTVPTLVLAGGADHAFMLDVAHLLVAGLPDASLVHLAGHGHDAPADVVAPPVLELLHRRA